MGEKFINTKTKTFNANNRPKIINIRKRKIYLIYGIQYGKKNIVFNQNIV